MFGSFRRSTVIACGLSLIGCAATAGSAPSSARAPGYEHTQVFERTRVSSSALKGPVLERAVFVRAVLQRNPSIESARQGFRAALAKVRQSGAFDDPMVDVGIAPLSIGSSRARFGYEVAVSQRLPWFGKRALETASAAAEAEAMRNDFEALRRELALTAIGLYDDYFVSARSLEINARHVELLRALRASATAQFEAGRGSAQDALQAEAELARVERDTLMLGSRHDVTVAQMNELLHREPDEPLPPPPSELALSTEPDRLYPERLPADAARVRPEIAAARDRARAEAARADRAAREHYPDFTVSTSYNSMWDMPEHRWMVGLGFNLPIQTGRRAGSADEARAMGARFESEAQRLESMARAQVYVAYAQLNESRRALELFERRILPVAKDQIDAARAGFITSRNPFMAVIEAERNLRSVELDYQMTRAECDRRHAELERALGRVPGLLREEQPR